MTVRDSCQSHLLSNIIVNNKIQMWWLLRVRVDGGSEGSTPVLQLITPACVIFVTQGVTD